MMACDSHSPYLNDKIFNKMLKVGQKYGIKHFIHGGDFWDQVMFSYWGVDPQDMTDFSYDVRYSKSVVNALTNIFEDVRFILGSHDVRFYRMLLTQGKATHITDIWKLLENPKIKVSSYRYADIGTEWRVTHPKSIVRAGGIPSVRIGTKFNRSMVFAHGHWWWWCRDPSSNHHLIAPGCLCDPMRIGYKSTWDTAHDEWTGGFLMVLDKNKPILFSADSPWELYLK